MSRDRGSGVDRILMPAASGAPERAPVYLVDACIYVFRGWHLFPDTLVAADGRPVNAVHGFVDFLARLHERTQARHVALCFDAADSHRARCAIYPAYKAHRDPPPAELVEQFRLCRAITDAAGLARPVGAGVEADDVIATLAGHAETRGLRPTLVTGDKDLAQAVGHHGEWWDFTRERRLDAQGVHSHFGVRPEQIADLLALAGDRSDNIPGIPGIGMATAARLLTRWGDLDTLFSHIDGVARMRFRGARRVARLLRTHEATARLARRLTGTLPVPGLAHDETALRRRPADTERLEQLLAEAAVAEPERRRLRSALTEEALSMAL